jgi:hypothetical protein
LDGNKPSCRFFQTSTWHDIFNFPCLRYFSPDLWILICKIFTTWLSSSLSSLKKAIYVLLILNLVKHR